MSSRYSICLSKEAIEKRFAIQSATDYRPRYNAAPSQLLPVISNTASDSISYFYWGQTPEWSNNKAIGEKLTHANLELIAQKASLRRAVETRRCLIPADGFYLWKSIGKKSKIPYRVIMNSGEAFSFAGIWEEYEDENEHSITTFKIITTTANPVVGEIQDAMPVLLTQEKEKAWLNNQAGLDELLAMLVTYPGEKMTKFTISPRINTIDIDDPSLIQAAPAADQYGNYSLFD
ncbi:SOS response-associated peptidase [Fulvivirgaceae bacterium BMA12]|uniref:Abasic site processing protein n=1 Tax=Agaribacillus aureus TaxID=3051825 RepID=A0ABT8LLW1_9BACT|nr:SOS response-associated peptidase [Fulvivirgaceae bacterium BMA12]